MTIVALTSVKGSPGVTTLAVALAATWPRADDSPVLLLEADPAGGVIGPRHDLQAEPSLASYMADARRGFDPTLAASNSQLVVSGVRALISPVDPAVSERSLSWGVASLSEGLRAMPYIPVVADLGRLDPVSPAMPIAQVANETLLVIEPSLEQAAIAVHRVRAFTELGVRLSLVCVGHGPDTPSDVAHALGLGLAAALPHEHRAADILAEAYRGKRRARRTILWQSVSGLANDLAYRLAAVANDRPAQFRTEAGAQPFEADA